MIKNQWSNIGWKIEKDKKLKETKNIEISYYKSKKRAQMETRIIIISNYKFSY